MKRFTETNKWDDPWYRKLKPSTKLLWGWMLDKCDAAGVIDIDLELASFQIGYEVNKSNLDDIGNRIEYLECGKIHIIKFIEFQYGELSRECKAHNPVFQSIEKHRVSKGYPKGIQRVQDTDKDKDKDKDRNVVVGENHLTPSLEEVINYSKGLSGIDKEVAETWWNECEGRAWNDSKGQLIVNWKPALMAYWRKWQSNVNERKLAKSNGKRFDVKPRSSQCGTLQAWSPKEDARTDEERQRDADNAAKALKELRQRLPI